ncbi:MAG: hypothetical protein MRY74_06305 [Neomegalonema sp.]|nr:hypothetical protein [Neomegalonema sp.]
MAEDSERFQFRLAAPQNGGDLFALTDVRHLVVGDRFLSTPPLLDAIAYYARSAQLERLDFWGRAARLHADRANDLLSATQRLCSVYSHCRFDQIDLLEDAEAMARCQMGRPFVILDGGDMLEAKLIDALKAYGQAFLIRKQF